MAHDVIHLIWSGPWHQHLFSNALWPRGGHFFSLVKGGTKTFSQECPGTFLIRVPVSNLRPNLRVPTDWDSGAPLNLTSPMKFHHYLIHMAVLISNFPIFVSALTPRSSCDCTIKALVIYISESMSIHKNSRISLNYYGPILKIQNLACTGERARSKQCIKHIAHEMTSRARETLMTSWIVKSFGLSLYATSSIVIA